MKCIAAIDQGTTSTRCILFDHSGKILAQAQEEHTQLFPQPGWVEHDPLQIWDNSRQVLLSVVQSAGMEKKDILAIGITNQRETTLVWERATGRPIHPAIVWQDTRTDGICQELAAEGGQDRFREKTGLPLATYFSAPKVKWILDNIPAARRLAENGDLLFGNMDTWLIWNLTGEHVTDVTNASRTLLMNLAKLDWDEDLLSAMEIPRSLLPDIHSSAEIYGQSRSLLAGVPVAGDLGDQQAALFGQACFSPGETKNTYGTGCFMLMNTGTKPILSHNGLLTTLAYKLGDQQAIYALEGSIAVAGALVQWLRDNLGLIQNSSDVEVLAGTVEDNGGLYFVPAFSGLFAPYWRSDARGAMLGMTRYINKGHIARAALEATAFQTCEVLDSMGKDSGVKLTELKVDGGMVANELLMQFQANILNVPVIRPQVHETTALGVAYAAGLAVGFWKDLEELRQNWGYGKKWKPDMAADKREKLLNAWKKAVTRTFNWVP
jgi:glycerol kinase